MNSSYNPNSLNNNNRKTDNRDENFLNPNYSVNDQLIFNAQKQVNEIQDVYSSIHRQAYDFTRGQGNMSVYQHNILDNNDLIPQNTNFYGPNFLRSSQSPEYTKTSNINYFNVCQPTDNMNSNNYENSNYYKNTPNQNINTFNNLNSENNNINQNRNIILGSTTNPTDSSDSFNNINIIQATPRQYNHAQNQGFFPEGIEPKLQNIVSTANFKCQLDLREIALKAKNAEYNPKRFAAVIMRIREPKTTALIFGSGKMVCTGARSEDESKTAAKQYARIIKKLGFPVKFSEFKIQNIVGSSDVKFPIRLEGLYNEHSRFCNYEPEMFPGLIYRMVKPKIVLLIFVSGKIVLTGAKERNDIFEAFRLIYPVLFKFKKKDFSTSITEQGSNSDE